MGLKGHRGGRQQQRGDATKAGGRGHTVGGRPVGTAGHADAFQMFGCSDAFQRVASHLLFDRKCETLGLLRPISML